MDLRRNTFRLLAGLVACSALAGSLPRAVQLHSIRSSGGAPLRVYGSGGSGAQRSPRHDALLADLARHATMLHTDSALAELHALNPAARFRQFAPGGAPYVLIDATSHGDAKALLDELVALGLRESAVYANDVGGWLPVTQLDAAGALAHLHGMRAALPGRRAGVVTSQGDFAQRSDIVRSANPGLTGAGVSVGVLSDSYNCFASYALPGSGVPASGTGGYAQNGFSATAAADIASGDLPAHVSVLKEADCKNYGAPQQLPYSDEGRAMLQIVHDVAPGAQLSFYTAFGSEADFANGIVALADAGATVVMDDIGYYDEPFYQDGLLAHAVDQVQARGVAYLSAAGNNGSYSYENLAPRFTAAATAPPNAGEQLLNFDPTGATTTTALPVSIPSLSPGDFVAVILHWDQPYVTGAPGSGGSANQLDLCVTGSGTDAISDLDGASASCTGPNATGSDPVQIMLVANPASASANTNAEVINILVGLAAGSAPGRIKVTVEGDGLATTINAFATHSAALHGHPGAAGALAVAAAFYFDTPRCGTTPATLESYSSRGGAPILFDTSGARLATPVTRPKPDVVGPDGANDTFLGFTLASEGYTGTDGLLSTSVTPCQNLPAYPNFFGTSAATPHVGGIVALLRQSNPALTPAQIYSALRSSALPMGSGAAPDADWGYGFVQADAALAALPVPPPTETISAAPASITLGASSTLSWSSTGGATCTASGAWSGAKAGSGSESVTPGAAGSQTYTLNCTAAGGTTSASTVVSVAADPPPAGSSGGGGAGGTGLLGAILLLALLRTRANSNDAR